MRNAIVRWLSTFLSSISLHSTQQNPPTPNSFHHENALLSDLFINGTHSSIPTPWKHMALETRWPNNTHHCSRLPRKKAATIQPSTAGCQTPKSETAGKKNGPLPPHADNTNHPAALKHLPRTRTKPLLRPKLPTSILKCKTSIYRITGIFQTQKCATHHNVLHPLLPPQN